MFTCEQCLELLWEQSFGLVDASQEQTLRDHLAQCPACQLAHSGMDTKRELLAQAARVIDSVPLFSPPADESGPVLLSIAKAQSSRAVPQKQHQSGSKPATVIRRHWPIWAAAASVILLVSGLLWHQKSLTHYEQQRNQAVARALALDNDIQQVSQKAKKTLAGLPGKLSQRHLQVTVQGPAQWQSGVSQTYRVQIQDMNGKPAKAKVTARLVTAATSNSKKRQIREVRTANVQGEGKFTMASSVAPGKNLMAWLEVEAKHSGGTTRFQEQISLRSPVFVVHLNFDKNTYRAGDILFFRCLVLDRFSQRPAGRPLAFRAIVRDGQGVQRIQLGGQTRPDGIGGGELALTPSLGTGEFVLEIDALQNRFPAVRRGFRIEPAQATSYFASTLKFDRAGYGPGADVRARLRLGEMNGPRVKQKPVTIHVNVDGKNIPTVGVPKSTNAKGEADLQFRLPRKLTQGKGHVEVLVKDGAATKKIRRSIPVVVPHLDVEFFPEGGHLVAGFSNRVYFRIRNRQGQALDLEGRVIDENQKTVALAQSIGRLGLGVFQFTPLAGVKYSLHTTSFGKAVKLPLPAVQGSGVLLSIPRGVIPAGNAIEVLVHHTQKKAGLLVTLSHRGRLVDQQIVHPAHNANRVKLTPSAEINGILKVTVHEMRQGQLLPRAERLVFRLPKKTLSLKVQTNNTVYQPGDTVALAIQATTEQKLPATGWTLAAVVDATSLAKANPGSPPSGFDYLLTTDLQKPQDLELAGIWVRDHADAHQSLDLFLGTQGWRSFADLAGPGDPVVWAKRNKEARRRADQEQQAILLLGNGSAIHDRYRRALKQSRQEIASTAQVQVAALVKTKKESLKELQRAEAALANFQDMPRQARRWGLAGLVAVLLGAGCICLIIGVIRIVRNTKVATPLLAISFGCLLICLTVVYFNKPSERDFRANLEDFSRRESGNELALRLPPMEWAPTTSAPMPSGLYAAPPSVKEERDPKTDGKGEMRPDAPSGPPKALGSAPKGSGLGGAGKDKKSLSESAAFMNFQKRYDANRKMQLLSGSGSTKGKDGLPPSHPAKGGFGSSGGKNAENDKGEGKSTRTGLTLMPIRYAHIHPRSASDRFADRAETVLWSPVLPILGGTAQEKFDLSTNVTTYQILLLAHDAQGRLGLAVQQLKVRPPNRP